MRILLAAALSLLAGVAAALADDLKATSKIDAVTLFPEGAEVTRIAHVTLAVGDQTVVLKDLPASLVSDSLRVQGEATGKVEIGSVDTRVFVLSEEDKSGEDARKKLQDQLQDLQDKDAALKASVAVATMQKQLITNLANLPNRTPVPGGNSAAGEPDWGQLFTLIGERLTTADKTIADAQIAKRGLDKQIAELQNQLNQQPQTQDQRTEVKVHVSAAAPLDATLRIRYQVPAAAWYPVYDARLETGDGANPRKLSLIRRAIVSQETGEPWDDVQLALSTTRPEAGTVAPELVPLAVDFAPQAVADEVMPASRDAAKVLQQSLREMKKERAAGGLAQNAAPVGAPAEPVAATNIATNVEQQRATTITTAFQAVYVITDRQTIKSGVGDKRVQIDIKSVEPLLSVRAVPKFSETAFLYAKYKLDADTFLLPGGVSLFRDGVFVGRGQIEQLIGGEEQQLGFGADDKVRIKFANLGRKAGETGLISTSKTDTQSFKMTVKNLHARPIDLRILDQVPVSLNDQIKVDMLADTAPPTVRDVDDKKGLLAWDLKLDAGKEQMLLFGYQVIWPNGQAVAYEEHPGPWAGPQK